LEGVAHQRKRIFETSDLLDACDTLVFGMHVLAFAHDAKINARFLGPGKLLETKQPAEEQLQLASGQHFVFIPAAMSQRRRSRISHAKPQSKAEIRRCIFA
jgi:hypothetical protein